MAKMGKTRFIHFLFTKVLLGSGTLLNLNGNTAQKDELAPKMFEDELELAYAVIDGVEARGERGNHSTHRVKFNSNTSS